MDGHGHQLDKKIFFLKIILKAKILQKFNEQIRLAKIKNIKIKEKFILFKILRFIRFHLTVFAHFLHLVFRLQ